MKKILPLLVMILLISSAIASPHVGSKAPEIKFSALLNSKTEQINFKGKIIILDFWATWCVPCIESFSTINGLINRYSENNDVVFLTITKEEKKIVQDFFSKRNIELNSFKAIDDDGFTFKNYEISGLPATFIINKNGILVWSGRVEDIKENYIDELVIEKTGYSSALADIKGMYYYTHLSKSDGGASSYYDRADKFWKFETDGSSYKTIIDQLSRGKLETPVRFINESSPKNTIACIKFKVDTSLLNEDVKSNFRDKYFPNSLAENYFISMLSSNGFEIKFTKERRKVNYFKVVDSKKLSLASSTQNNKLSLIRNPREGEFEFENITLNQISQIGPATGFIIRDPGNNMKRYNISLDAKDIGSLVKSLEVYGLTLTQSEEAVPVMNVIFD